MRKKSYNLPPCPDPELYVLVKTKEGRFWRRKRSPAQAAIMNEGMRQSVERMKICAPAAKTVAEALRPWLQGLDTGRLVARIGARLRKELGEYGDITYKLMNGYEFQPDYPLHRLLKRLVTIVAKDGYVKLSTPLYINKNIATKNTFVDGFYFTSLLVHGNAANENEGVEVIEKISEVYPIDTWESPVWEEVIPLPEPGVPWMLILKVTCRERGVDATDGVLQGMKVLGVGVS